MHAELVRGEKLPAEKARHEDVEFEHPSDHDQKHCSLCVHYINSRVPRCQLVRSPIRANDYCEWFEFRD